MQNNLALLIKMLSKLRLIRKVEVAFLLKIPYLHPLGHRGFSHSVLFAVGMGLVMPMLFFREHRLRSRDGFFLWLFFFLSSLSHGLLDAMTTGGEGVGFFIPFDNERYFFPFRPIVVSPIGIKRFFSEWGLRVLSSELVWVGIPALNIYIGQLLFRRLFVRRKDPTEG